MKRTVLVLGGSYFIGKRIVEVLIKNDYAVYTLNRGTRPEVNDRVRNIICDRNDEKQMQEVLKDICFDIIIDVSGLNRQHMFILCDAVKDRKVEKYVFISSSSVYRLDECRVPIKESCKLGQNQYWGDYGTNKIDAEEYLISRFENTGTTPVILRPPYVYGENNNVYRESFVFDHISSQRPIIIPNRGETRIQFIHADDLANIVVKTIEVELPNPSILNVGNRNAVSFNEWIDLCEKAAGKSVEKIHFNYKENGFSERDFFPFFDYDNVLDVEKLSPIYNEEIPMSDGLKRAYEWYQDNKDSIQRKAFMWENEDKIYKIVK